MPDPSEEEKDRLLREYLGQAPMEPPTAADVGDNGQKPGQNLSAGEPQQPMAAPQTRLEATGRAAQAQGSDEFEQALQARALQSMSDHDKPIQHQTAGGPDWTTALGPVAALALDAFVNKGRGAGQIVGAAASNIDADRRVEQQHLNDIEKQAQRKSADPLTAYLGYRNVLARDREGGIHQQTANTSADRLESTTNPNSDLAKGKIDLTKQGSTARREGILEANHAGADTIAADAAAKAGDVRTAQHDADHEFAPTKAKDVAAELATTSPQRVADAGGIALAQSEARQPNVEKNAAASDARRAADEQRRADLAATKPLTAAQSAQEADKYATENKFALDSAKHLMRLEQITGKYKPGELPGVGMIMGREPTGMLAAHDTMADFIGKPDQRAKDAMEIRNLQSEMSNAVERQESGAAIGLKEDDKYLIREGAKPGASEEQFRQGVAAYKRTLVGRLTAFRVGKEGQADKVLGSQGISPEWLGVHAPEAVPAVPGTPGNTGNNGPPPNLGTQSHVPPNPAGAPSYEAAKAQTKPYRIRNKRTGKVSRRPLGPGELAQLESEDGGKRFEILLDE